MSTGRQGRGGMLGWFRRGAGCVAAVGLIVALAARATPLAEPDARAVREVVEAQLDAFAADDAERAFAYASPSIQARFGDSANFMAMVRGAYPMVLRPATVAFFQARAVDGTSATVSQAVHLRDREGRLWLATYVLERSSGTIWRINACMVAPDNGQSLT